VSFLGLGQACDPSCGDVTPVCTFQLPPASKGLSVTLAGLHHTFVVRMALPGWELRLRCQLTGPPTFRAAGGGPVSP
jgi:hypothetical protein